MSKTQMTEASQLLADALEQMDGIIAGTQLDNSCHNGFVNFQFPNNGNNCNDQEKILNHVNELRALIETVQQENNKIENYDNVQYDIFPKQLIDPDTRQFLVEWLQSTQLQNQNGGTEDVEELQDRCKRLEADKENMTLQVSVLNDQIEALNDKVKDLEMSVKEKQDHLNNSEEMLQHELLNKSSLETNKLDMMSNISELKLKLTYVEKQNMKFEDKIKSQEIDTSNLKLKILEKDSEIASLQSKISRMLGNNKVDSNVENNQLQKAVDSLMASNSEKDQKLEEMKKILMKNKKFNDMAEKVDGRFPLDDEMSDSALTTTPSSSRKSDTETSSPAKADLRISDKPPPVPRHATPPHFTAPTATSTPIHSSTDSPVYSIPDDSRHPLSKNSKNTKMQRANSAEEISIPNKTPPMKARHGVKHYGTVPRQHAANLLEQLEQDYGSGASQSTGSPQHQSKTKSGKSSGVSFAGDEILPQLPESQSSCTLQPSDVSPASNKDKPKGIKKIFGRLRRSSSDGFDQDNAFKRGGMRATAGPRLGWSKDMQKSPIENVDIPFREWDKDQIALWLHHLGLSAYIGECKRSVKNGAQLLKARPQQLEKDVGVKNALHRKKLYLALQAISTERSCQDLSIMKMGALDYHWVTRWLDDIGMPQYKDVFYEARIDGRVLHNLTVEDLFSLKITNMLHHVSIKRGIHLLRLNNFNPNCLRRRPILGESTKFSVNEVALWTNHRVMEWLRSVDLSEYAPNLRGSGVHGALMVYEPKFNTDLLATLLSIPPSKTLLRRHLNTHFKELLGLDTIQLKRDEEAAANYIPLTPSAKVKAVRRGHFTLRKKAKADVEFEDYVCSMSIKCLSEMDAQQNDETAAKEIEAVSDEIDSLTIMLKDDAFLANMTTTNV